MPGLIERIRGVFRPVREPFAPLGLGPSISDPDARHSSFAIASGPLDGTRLRLDAVVQPRSADFSLFPAPRPSSGRLTPDTSHPTSEASDTRDSPLAHCHYDRDPNGNEVLWDIVVHPGHRGRGLAALLVRLSLRRLLLAGRGRAWLAMRRLMQVDSGAGPRGPAAAPRVPASRVRLQNVGIGIIAVRLGLRPEPALESMLAPGNVASAALIRPEAGSPPGYLFRLKTLPGLLVVCLLDPGTLRPQLDERQYRRFLSPAELCRQARGGTALVGNIDYELTDEGITPCCRHLAETAAEYRLLLRRLRRPGRN